MSGRVIDLARVRAARGDYLGRLRADRHALTAVPPAATAPEPAREFRQFDSVEERSSGRRGIVARAIGRDRYDVMFYTGQAGEPWRVTRWGFQLRLHEPAARVLRRALRFPGQPPCNPDTPTPPSAA